MPDVTPLADLLLQAARTPRGVHFLHGAGRETRSDYATVVQRASGLLGHWQRCGMQRGDEVIIYVRDNRDFIDAFWACQLGGLVAVPLPAGLQAASMHRLTGVAACLDHAWLYSEQQLVQRFRQHQAGGTRPELRVCLLENVPPETVHGEWQGAQPQELALIQFSSGSTGSPRGVQLSHANLLANIDAITRAAAISAADVTLSWMPLSHDMGLVGFHLVPLANALEQVLMDTALFVRRPALWLQTADRLGATLLCSPNFGYQHYLQRGGVAAPGLDLGRVRLLFSGAEPVSAPVCRTFVQQLENRGLRPEAVFPVYGLAEASLAASFPQPGSGLQTQTVAAAALAPGDRVRAPQPGERNAELVCLGNPVDSCEVRIVVGGQVQPSGRVGRVQIRGSSVTRGYYPCPAAADQVFFDGWLDTGDLGFFGNGGLIICGRAREVMFFAGQNLYPQDIEELLEQVGCVPPGKVAVTAVRSADGAEDRLLVCLQHRGSLEEFAPRVTAVQAVLSTHAGLQAEAVIPVARLPRTTSGKLRRYQLVEAFERGEYRDRLAVLQAQVASQPGAASSGETERRLLELCARRFPGKSLQPEQNLLELGADSLTLVSLHEDIDACFPGRVEITDVFDYPSVRALAAYIER